MSIKISDRSHSTVLDCLLLSVGVSPATLHGALTTRTRPGRFALVSERSSFGRKLLSGTSANRIRITRPRDTLLLELDFLLPSTRFWSYWEHSRRDVRFTVGTALPETIGSASRGRPLGEIIGTGFLDHVVILGGASMNDGTEFRLRTSWT